MKPRPVSAQAISKPPTSSAAPSRPTGSGQPPALAARCPSVAGTLNTHSTWSTVRSRSTAVMPRKVA